MESSSRAGGRLLAGLLIAPLVLSGCGQHKAAAKASNGDLFDNQQQASISCLVHQKSAPGPLYTGGTSADTAHILLMMQYYTSNGAKPYCDRAPATATDRSWAQLYVSLGGLPANVGAVLNGR